MSISQISVSRLLMIMLDLTFLPSGETSCSIPGMIYMETRNKALVVVVQEVVRDQLEAPQEIYHGVPSHSDRHLVSNQVC